MNQISLMITRRQAIVCILVILPDYQMTQIQAQMITTLLLMSYTASVDPYLSRISMRQEFFNESTVILAAYHLLIYTEWISNFEIKF